MKNNFFQQREIYEAVKTGDVDKTLALINTGVDLEFKYKDSDTLLKIAVDYRYLEIVRLLIGAEALPVFRDESLLRRALNYALSENDIAILKELVEAGIDVNQSLENDDETAIMLAAHHGNFEVVKMLVSAGANVNALTEGGYFALWNAANQGWQDIYDYLTPLTYPELRQEAEELLPAGLIYRQRANDKFTSAFIEAAVMGNLNDVNKAIEEGVNVNAISCDGVIALNIASFWGHVSVVRALIGAGANVDSKNEDDTKTALIKAIEGISTAKSLRKEITGQIAIIRFLIQSGADVNAKTNDGWTALLEAGTYAGNVEVVKLLLRAGADINAKDNQGDTALSRALKAGHPEIVQLLRDAGATED